MLLGGAAAFFLLMLVLNELDCFGGIRSMAERVCANAYRVSFEWCRNLRSKTTFQLSKNVLYI